MRFLAYPVLLSRLAFLEANRKSLSLENEEQASEISGLEEDNASLNEAVAVSTRQLSVAGKEIAKNEEDASRLIKKLKASDALLASEVANRNRLTDENDRFQRQVALLTGENLRFHSENTRLQQELLKSLNLSDVLQDQVTLLSKINELNHKAVESAIASTVGFNTNETQRITPEGTSDGQ